MIPEDVQRILQEADEERKARETASVITEDDLPQDLDDEIEEEEEEEKAVYLWDNIKDRVENGRQYREDGVEEDGSNHHE